MNVSKRVLCGLKWLNALVVFVVLGTNPHNIFDFCMSLRSAPAEKGLWIRSAVLYPGQSQEQVVRSLQGYYILPAGYMFSTPITSQVYWTPKSPWKPETQPRLCIKTDTHSSNITSLWLTFESGVLKEKSFCWD
ncbi:hypothetical protein [Armatimonas sp.]|uniref:hypothetical protein n=1 Tax=Armatimonas sp. TaxID=1872638 RepID=UPI00286AE42F|nr:hypothetical protein [Armatimonas sp.]